MRRHQARLRYKIFLHLLLPSGLHDGCHGYTHLSLIHICLIEQIADANNKRYGRSSEKLDVIAGQLELELIFNESEALTETLYGVEPAEEDVIQVGRRKRKGKREEDLKDLPIEVIPHTLSDEKLQELFGPDGWKRLPDEVYKRVRVQPAVYTVEAVSYTHLN